jgi:hypothetical protein
LALLRRKTQVNDATHRLTGLLEEAMASFCHLYPELEHRKLPLMSR